MRYMVQTKKISSLRRGLDVKRGVVGCRGNEIIWRSKNMLLYESATQVSISVFPLFLEHFNTTLSRVPLS